MSQSIQPLRIQKSTPLSSPTKMNGAPAQRPLAELSPMERRRNSPSFNQITKKPLLDSSPFDTSPFAAKFNTSPFTSNSPHAYWQNRENASPTRQNMENRDPKEDSPAPSKRSSIENLKRASRVKNSNMFAREQKLEYDPTAPPVERPLAAGRPLSSQPNYMASKPGDGDQTAKFPLSSPLKSLNRTAPQAEETPSSPSKPPGSPSKSSLSKTSRYGHVYDPENGIYSEDDDSFADKQLPPGKSLHRHAKSVTFDAAPPQINEYEMTTPVPSSIASGSREGSYDSREDDEDDEELSFERGSSMDRDDSFDASLEDTDKTPVVLPEDWRFMSPALATNELAEKSDDVFVDRISDLALKDRLSPIMDRESPRRTDSINSNGERRPLPPLPPSWAGLGSSQAQSDTTNVSQPADNLFSAQRNLPSPPRPAPMSKIELQSMGSASMSMEDRLRLMMLHDPEKPQNAKSAAEMQRERRLRRAGASPDNNMEKKGGEIKIHEDGPGDDRVAGEQEYQLPRISRESILRKVKSQTLHDDYDYSSPVPSSSPERPPFANIDRDVPIPSLEDRAGRIFADDGVMIKQEDDAESEVDVYAIPDMYQTRPLSPQPGEDFSKVGGDEDNCREEDDESHYSTDLNERENEGPPTPRVTSPLTSTEENKSKRMSLPQFASMLGQDDFGLSLSSYMTPSPPADEPVKAQQFPALPAMPVPTMARPLTPEEQLRPSIPGYGSDEEEPQTPESVIRHSISGLERSESPAIPEPSATIKAPGGLKTRASLAPADARAMAEARRKVSGDQPDIPPIPAKHKNRTSIILEADSTFFEHTEPDSQKQVKRKSSLVQLDITVDEMDEGLSFGLDREFDRLIEAQKKGYLMRQNTKMVVASSGSHDSAADRDEANPIHPRGTRSAGNSPVKQSHAGTWTTEPWNGKMRRKSIRQSAGSPMKKPPSGPVPPLPGMPSNVTTSLDSVNETEQMQDIEEVDDGRERGRVFVKVVGIKELDLPLPRGERTYFALTLDNGLHCVTTSWLELGRFAPIGQEFELVVLNELEFQLTLHTKIEEPKPAPKPVESPTKIKSQKPSTFSRVFASPRKRKELEIRQQEEAQRLAKQKQAEAQANKQRSEPTAWSLLHNLVGKDGSFARSYVSLKDHETHAYGRPYTVDVPCFNEWAMEEVRTVGSTKSGRGAAAAALQRKAPYKIGKLELQFLYVPMPKEATDDDMPKSMNACIRELQDAENTSNQSWEGNLSQQGGDCPYWRRRFFRLQGSKLTAYHEATRQPRATINLAKASKLIDDKSSLTQKEVSGKGGARRRSAFAAEEEGYMFVEEGFRVRFGNGETIDFYADSTAEKEGWMRALVEVVGKDTKDSRSWTELVLKRERVLAAKATKSQATNSTAMKSAPPTPGPRGSSNNQKVSYSRPLSQQQTHRPNSSSDKPLPNATRDPRGMTAAERRAKARSMLF